MSHSLYPTVILPVRRNLQDTHYDCGPASLAIILETLGRHYTEETLMKWGHTTPQDGTTPEMLDHILNKIEVRHEIFPHASIGLVEQEIRNFNLCLIDYQAWADGGSEIEEVESGHYSVIFGFNETHFYLADPAKRHTKVDKEWGFRTIGKDLFAKRWYEQEENGEKTYHWMMSVPLVQ